MGQYEKALQDADVAISLAPDWPKGYFRRGRALAGLKVVTRAIVIWVLNVISDGYVFALLRWVNGSENMRRFLNQSHPNFKLVAS